MKKVVLLSLLCFLVIAGGLVYYYWYKFEQPISEKIPTREEAERDLLRVEELLEGGRGRQAYEIIRKYDRMITPKTEIGNKWLQLLTEAAQQIGDTNQLLIIQEYFPEVIQQNEKASIVVGREYISQKRVKDFDQIRSGWKGRETQIFEWTILDADKLVLDGKREQALALLESKKFKDEQEIQRYIRLAMISSNDPRQAWEYLSKATELDPENPNVRLYRAKFLESANKIPLALSEYITAAQLKPDSLFIKDELAEFLRRNNQYPQATELWKSIIESNGDTPLVLKKTWFWSKVAFPVSIDWKQYSTKQSPFLNYLLTLEPGIYWNQKAFESIPNYNRHLRGEQETLWLRVIEFLKNGDEQKAMELLKNHPFKQNSWHPEMETALQRILNYRINGTLVLNEPAIPRSQNQSNSSVFPFFQQLEQLAVRIPGQKDHPQIPQDLKTLLESQDAIPVAFISGGWYEAGLDLLQTAVFPKDYPDWVKITVVQAIQQNRGNEEALNFARKQTPFPELDLYISQLLIDTKNFDTALENLNRIIKKNDSTSSKARWLKALILIYKNDLDEANKVVLEDSKLAESIYGKEILARIALLKNDLPKAEKIYQNIQDQSAEAKSYFARKAFQEKDFKKAREITEQLFLESPNNPVIRKNLQRIMMEQKKREQEQPNEPEP